MVIDVRRGRRQNSEAAPQNGIHSTPLAATAAEVSGGKWRRRRPFLLLFGGRASLGKYGIGGKEGMSGRAFVPCAPSWLPYYFEVEMPRGSANPRVPILSPIRSQSRITRRQTLRGMFFGCFLPFPHSATPSRPGVFCSVFFSFGISHDDAVAVLWRLFCRNQDPSLIPITCIPLDASHLQTPIRR